MIQNKVLDFLHAKFLSKESKEIIEKVFLRLAIVCFIVHLALILMVNFNLIEVGENAYLLKNPIAAIYTPFSFILVYEVYLLIYYLPKSTSIYVLKQYEIITLIIFRRLFKDLSNLDLTADWFNNSSDLQFTFDLLTALLLFYLIYLFQLNHSRNHDFKETSKAIEKGILKFVYLKKGIAVVLVPTLFFISIYSFLNWSFEVFNGSVIDLSKFRNVNNIFFEEFFNILIVTDVFLLLFSFFQTDQFHKVLRNSGFIISTILLRLSFSSEGITNNLLILAAVTFGLLIIWVHNKFESQVAHNVE